VTDINAMMRSIGAASTKGEARKPIPELTLHPLCTLIPPCTDEEFKELKEDIKKNGLQVPIKLFESKILDGRSRYGACLELEKEGHRVEFRHEDFTGTTSDAIAYVISINVKRRHLKASQRAIIAARLVTTTNGGDRSVKLLTEITQEDVARMAGVAVKMVIDAKKVLDRPDPDLANKVLNGEVAVAKAATQVRAEERKTNGKPPRKNEKSAADLATKAYTDLQEKLMDGLRELKEVSSLAHAKEYAKKTKQRLDETIESMTKEDAEVKKAA
jgi:ParB-like chromosome segregation protein Spo0J